MSLHLCHCVTSRRYATNGIIAFYSALSLMLFFSILGSYSMSVDDAMAHPHVGDNKLESFSMSSWSQVRAHFTDYIVSCGCALIDPALPGDCLSHEILPLLRSTDFYVYAAHHPGGCLWLAPQQRGKSTSCP